MNDTHVERINLICYGLGGSAIDSWTKIWSVLVGIRAFCAMRFDIAIAIMFILNGWNVPSEIIFFKTNLTAVEVALVIVEM